MGYRNRLLDAAKKAREYVGEASGACERLCELLRAPETTGKSVDIWEIWNELITLSTWLARTTNVAGEAMAELLESTDEQLLESTDEPKRD